MLNLPGRELEPRDLDKLNASGISRELASQARLRRVASQDGAGIVGRNGAGDYAGIVFPYIWPGDESVREYRLRRDRPELEYHDGKPRERNKYISPPGRGNMLYFVPGTPAEWLSDASLPLVITEGEKKTLALWALAWHGLSDATDRPRFCPVGLPGVWNWRGTTGRATGPDGSRRDVKGPIPDLDRITWRGRKATIAFDANVAAIESVQAARAMLTRELQTRGAKAVWMEWPAHVPAGVNGIDDYIGSAGPETALALIAAASAGGRRNAKPERPEPQIVTIEELSRMDLLGEHFSDYGNSRRLITLHGKGMRYCHAFAKWLVWDGRRWAVDDGERARDLSQATILEFARQALAAKNETAARFAAGCLNSQRITNALREAQPHLAIRPAELDTHADLLNCENGTLDLRTGQLREHRREDFITKLVHHDYRPDAECPVFLAFLERTTANHPGLMGYLQRAFGYSLTGHTIEKAVFLLHGKGDNGKSTLLTAFLKILEEYGVLLQIDTLMARPESNNTQADLADLRGARFVMTSETEEGQRLAEGKLKRITQGMGRIKATRKYENPVEFPECHKLWIDANHLPIIRGTDNAIWNRLHPVPFDVTIAKAEQNKELPAKLAAETEGILAWAVAGAGRWYAEGLGKPSDVQQAGDAWRAQSDQIGRFIAEACMVGKFAQARGRQVYQAYRKWAEEAGEHPATETAFGLRIIEQFEKRHTKAGTVYQGVALRAEVTGDGL
jgi:putative DNA primase/helicase